MNLWQKITKFIIDMKNLIEMLQAIFGKKIISGTIGTRTNVIKLPSNKSNPRLKEFDVFRSSENPAVLEKLKKVIEDEAPYIAQMNDKERLIYEGNVKRLHDYLITTGEIKPAISAEVVGLGTKEPISGKGLESLLEQSGQVSPPGTLIGDIQSRINKLKGLGKEMEKQTGEKAGIGDILKDLGASQQSMSRLNDEGLVRAAARQILINDIKAGKIKNITVSEAINMGEPLDPFRQIYGEGALEQLDSLIPNLRGLKTEVEAEKLARSKFKFEPDENRLPGSVSIEEGRKAEQEFGINKPAKVSDFKAEATKRTSIDDLIDEYNANQDRLLLTDDEGGTLITYPEYNRLKDRNEEIAKALEGKGISSKVEEAPQAEIIPFRKKPTEPEKKAKGGSVGLDYLMGIEPEDTTRKNFALGSFLKQPISTLIKEVSFPAPSITLDAKPAVVRPEDDVVNRYRGYLNSTTPVQSDLEKRYRELINPSNPMLLTPATGLPVSIPTPVIEGLSFTSPQGEKIKFGGGAVGLIKPNGEPYTGPVPENIQNSLRMVAAEGGRVGFKIGSGKKILDLITGANKKSKSKITKKPTKEEYEEYAEILDDSENTVVQGNETFEQLDALVKKQKDYEDFMYMQYKRGKLDPVAGENTKDRMDFLRKKAEEAEMTGDRRLFSINEMKELEGLEKTFSPMGTSNKINISDPKTAESFKNFARENDPEGFKKIQKIVDDINNRNTLEGFDVKDRKPNSKGGLNYLMGL